MRSTSSARSTAPRTSPSSRTVSSPHPSATLPAALSLFPSLFLLRSGLEGRRIKWKQQYSWAGMNRWICKEQEGYMSSPIETRLREMNAQGGCKNYKNYYFILFASNFET